MESPVETEGGRSGQVLRDGKRGPAAPGKWFQESPGRRRWEKRSNTYKSRACGWMDWVGCALGASKSACGVGLRRTLQGTSPRSASQTLVQDARVRAVAAADVAAPVEGAVAALGDALRACAVAAAAAEQLTAVQRG